MSNRRWWRPRLRFNLLTVLVLLTLAGVLIAIPVRNARHQRLVARTVMANGGTVTYDWEKEPTSFYEVKKGKPPGPVWLRGLIGDEYFQKIVAIGPRYGGVVGQKEGIGQHVRPVTSFASLIPQWKFEKPEALDTMLRLASRLRSIRRVDLSAAPLRDSSLHHLKRMRQLEELNLGGTDLTGEGLIHLRRMKQLRKLGLSYTHISDSAMLHIKRLRSLKTLDLAGTEVRGRRLGHLQELKGLNDIDLSFTVLDPAFADEVTQVHSLAKLNLRGCVISTDPSYYSLHEAEVNEFNQHLFAMTLDSLVNVKQLQQLQLDGTCATINAVQQFQQRKPQVDLQAFKGVESLKKQAVSARAQPKPGDPKRKPQPATKSPPSASKDDNPFGA